MMKFEFKDAKIWKACMSAVSSLVDEAVFVLSPDGMKMRAMDSSHVALVELDIPPKAFETFEVKKRVTIGIDIPEMMKVIARAKTGEGLTAELDEGDGGRLRLVFAGPPVRKFNVPLIDVRETDYPDPKLAFTATMEVQSNVILDGVKDAELISDAVEVDVTKDGLFIRAEGDKGASELALEVGNATLQNFAANPGARAKYSINYLGNILKNASPTVVGVKLGNDMPIQIIYPIGEGRARFLVAPRVEE